MICSAGEVWRRSTGPIVWESIAYRQEGERYPTYYKERKANWIGHSLSRRNLIKHGTARTTEGKMEMTGRWGRSKLLLNDLKENRKYLKLKEEASDRTVWRTRFGTDFEAVLRHDRRMNGYDNHNVTAPQLGNRGRGVRKCPHKHWHGRQTYDTDAKIRPLSENTDCEKHIFH